MSKVLLIYHYFHPDNVVSARLFTQLAEGLIGKGHTVDVITSNRMCHATDTRLPHQDTYNDIRIYRANRPKSNRSSIVSRAFSVIIMLTNWLFLLTRLLMKNRPNAVIFGTDPPLGYMLAPLIKVISPKTKLALWSFDLYPEALVAAGKIKSSSMFYKFLGKASRRTYRSIDHVFSLGSCMTKHLSKVTPAITECVPWSILEISTEDFANNLATIAANNSEAVKLLYAGNLGLAHSANFLAKLAREKASVEFQILVSGRGHKHTQLKEIQDQLPNKIKFLDFVDEKDLAARLQSADIHIVSLEDAWCGIVVPSKFFSALAVGRPVLFLGSEQTCIAKWIRRYKIGWVQDGNAANILQTIADEISDPHNKRELFQRCRNLYHEKFQRSQGINHIDGWIKNSPSE